MGLLDFTWDKVASVIDFPNFDAFAQSNQKQTSDDAMSNSAFSTSSADSSSRDRCESVSTASDGPSPSSSYFPQPTLHASNTSTRKPSQGRRPSRLKVPPTPTKPRERSMSFDLYGEDDELQKAEPKLGKWCEKCCKECDVH